MGKNVYSDLKVKKGIKRIISHSRTIESNHLTNLWYVLSFTKKNKKYIYTTYTQVGT